MPERDEFTIERKTTLDLRPGSFRVYLSFPMDDDTEPKRVHVWIGHDLFGIFFNSAYPQQSFSEMLEDGLDTWVRRDSAENTDSDLAELREILIGEIDKAIETVRSNVREEVERRKRQST